MAYAPHLLYKTKPSIMKTPLILLLAAAALSCGKTNSGTSEAAIPIVRYADAANVSDKFTILHLDASDVKGLTNNEGPLAQFPDSLERTLPRGIEYIPVNPDNPLLGGIIVLQPCKKICKRVEGFGRCDCPPDLGIPGRITPPVREPCALQGLTCKQGTCSGTCKTRWRWVGNSRLVFYCVCE